MEKKADLLIVDQIIRLEVAKSSLYFLFSTLFQSESDFWWEISLEVSDQVELLKELKAQIISDKIKLLCFDSESISPVTEAADNLEKMMQTFSESSPSLGGVLKFSHDLEKKLEKLYLNLMEKNLKTAPVLPGIINKINTIGKKNTIAFHGLINNRD